MSVLAPTADRMAAMADRSSWLWRLWGVVAIGLAYGLVYTSMRLAISHNLPQDDVTANILAQTLEPGYVVRQPPLHEWLLWSVQRLTGPTLLSFLIIKYGLLTATNWGPTKLGDLIDEIILPHVVRPGEYRGVPT